MELVIILLITGITGHSGRHFLNELAINHYNEKPIRCVVREQSDTTFIDRSGLQIEKRIGNLDDQTFVDRAMDNVDTVIHIASIFYSETIIRAAVKKGVKKVVLVHTTGIYSKYKSASEDYKNIENSIMEIVRSSHSNLKIVYLRPTMIYGYLNDRNMIVFIKLVDKLRLFPIINHGKNLIQPVNGKDLGRAYYQVLTHSDIDSGDYVLSGERPISMKDMLELISRFLGKNITFIHVPLSLATFCARILKVLTVGKVDYVEKVLRMGEDRHFSHRAAKDDFGYNPMPFAEGLELEVAEYLREVRRK